MLYTHFSNMQKRQGMYLVGNVLDIHKFVYAYGIALSEHSIIEDNFEHFQKFQPWIEQKTKFFHKNWAQIIGFESLSDQESVDNFFKFLNQFKEENIESSRVHA